MSWQDLTISIINIILSASLLPQLYYGFKHKLGVMKHQTSIPTFLGLYTLAITYFTLDLHFSTAITAITATIWAMLFVQRLIYKHPA